MNPPTGVSRMPSGSVPAPSPPMSPSTQPPNTPSPTGPPFPPNDTSSREAYGAANALVILGDARRADFPMLSRLIDASAGPDDEGVPINTLFGFIKNVGYVRRELLLNPIEECDYPGLVDLLL